MEWKNGVHVIIWDQEVQLLFVLETMYSTVQSRRLSSYVNVSIHLFVSREDARQLARGILLPRLRVRVNSYGSIANARWSTPRVNRTWECLNDPTKTHTHISYIKKKPPGLAQALVLYTGWLVGWLIHHYNLGCGAFVLVVVQREMEVSHSCKDLSMMCMLVIHCVCVCVCVWQNISIHAIYYHNPLNRNTISFKEHTKESQWCVSRVTIEGIFIQRDMDRESVYLCKWQINSTALTKSIITSPSFLTVKCQLQHSTYSTWSTVEIYIYIYCLWCAHNYKGFWRPFGYPATLFHFNYSSIPVVPLISDVIHCSLCNKQTYEQRQWSHNLPGK